MKDWAMTPEQEQRESGRVLRPCSQVLTTVPTDRIVYLICESRVSNVRHADAAHGRFHGCARELKWQLLSSYNSFIQGKE